jgi:hypothetical protein
MRLSIGVWLAVASAIVPPGAHAQSASMLGTQGGPAASITTASHSHQLQPASGSNGMSPERLRKLMRPLFNLGIQWQAETDGVEISSYDARVTLPLFPIWGPPPPMVSVGFEYTDWRAPSHFDLPGELYESSIGLSWLRKRNDRWMFRWMLGVANATDGKNHSSDSWQFRGGGFALYRPNERWTWTFGAIALGRNDIPVVPAIGLIYQPNPEVRFDLAFPRPRASVLLVDDGCRQQWAYVGAGLDGGTWGYERANGTDDQVTYRDWRLVLGWESSPRPEPGMPFAIGRKFGAEIGYAFGRQFEFESELPDISIGDTVMFRAIASF